MGSCRTSESSYCPRCGGTSVEFSLLLEDVTVHYTDLGIYRRKDSYPDMLAYYCKECNASWLIEETEND